MKKLCLICSLMIVLFQAKATNHLVTLSTDNAENPKPGMLGYCIENSSDGDKILS